MAKRGGFPGGMPGNMNNLMKQAQRMQRQMEETTKELESKEYTASSGGGAVSVTVNGKKEVLSVTIKPEAVDPEDVEMLQDMVVAAVNEALRAASEAANARMNAVMEPKEPPASQKSDEERREAFIAKYGLTEREWDVFSQMISSDSSAQEIADCLFLSKRTVERHISALYEKTGAKSRITMYLLYRND